MIDYDALKDSARGQRYDRLVALLIGVVAVLAAALAVVQANESLAEARANAQTRRLAAELTTRVIGGGAMGNDRIINGQRALLVSVEGTSRGFVGLQQGDPAAQAIGAAEVAAGERLAAMVAEMGALPEPDGPLDPYAQDVLASPGDQQLAILAEQNGWADAAIAASDRSSRSVMGLSLLALAGVMAGLAAVVGSGRTGRALLLLGYASAAGAFGLLLLASGVLGG